MGVTLAQLSGAVLMAMVIVMVTILLGRVVRASRSLGSTSLCELLTSPMSVMTRFWLQARSAEMVGEVFKCLRARRLDCARVVAYMLWLVVLATSATLATRLLLGSSTEIFNGVGFLLLSLLTTLSQIFPGVFFRRSFLAIAHIFIMGVLSAMALDDADEELAIAKNIGRFMGALMCGGLYLWSPLIVVTNAVLLSCNLVTKLRIFAGSPNLSLLLITDVLACLSIIALFMGLEVIALYSAQKEVEQRHGKCELSAVSALLDMMCDALVHLDADMVMEEHSPKLAAMLMHGAGQSLKGKAFSTLIPVGEDAHRVESIASTCKAAQGSVPEPSLNLWRLRDAIGNHVPVMVFHVPFLRIGGRIHHIMGIREEVGNGGSGTDLGRRDFQEFGARFPAAQLRPDFAEVLGRGDLAALSPSNAGEDPPVSPRRKGSVGGGLGMSNSSSSNSSAGLREFCVDRPDPRMAVNVFLESTLPVHAVGPRLKQRLGLEDSDAPRLGSLMQDSGERLLARALDAMEDTKRQSGPGAYFVELGEFDMRSKRGQGPEEFHSWKFWMDFAIPAPEEHEEDASAFTTSSEVLGGHSKELHSENTCSASGGVTFVLRRSPRRSQHGRFFFRGTSAEACQAREPIHRCGGGTVSVDHRLAGGACHLKL